MERRRTLRRRLNSASKSFQIARTLSTGSDKSGAAKKGR
jgi:hypothetical protein